MEFYPLYDLFRLPFFTSVRTYYKRIQFKNKAVIFPDRPVIIAMNHPNAFMDPIAFSSQCTRKMFYLARGDSFKKGISWALEGVGIIPIYRLSDAGREGVKKNDESFEVVSKHLAKNHSVIIFPEGLCIQERRLRNLKKGCARIVFYSMEELKNPDLVVIPVGVNYQNDPSKFRHSQFFIVGEPIYVKDYFDGYLQNNAKAINNFTNLLQQKMKETVVHINDPANDELVSGIENIFLEEYLEEKNLDKKNIENSHKVTLKIVEGVNRIGAEQPEKNRVLDEKIKSYIKNLKSKGIRDKLVRKKYEGMSSSGSLFIRSILFLCGIPFWIGGLITNYVPYFASWKIAKKLLKNIEWYAAVSMLIGTFLFGFYYIAQFLTVWFVFHDWRIFLSFLPVPFLLGWFSVHFSSFRKKLFGSFRMHSLKKNKTEYEKIKLQRDEIIKEIKSFVS